MKKLLIHYSLLPLTSNMVDVAQLVSASDCGSEGRGFDSHHPPHKKYLPHKRKVFFMGSDGSRKPGPAARGKKHAGGMFFRAWETPLVSGRIRYGWERKPNLAATSGPVA